MKATNEVILELIEKSETSFEKFVFQTILEDLEIVEDVVINATPTLFVEAIRFDKELPEMYDMYQKDIDELEIQDDIDSDDDPKVKKFLNAFVEIVNRHFDESDFYDEES